jgi:cobalt-zinc-cadmium efflux system protein
MAHNHFHHAHEHQVSNINRTFIIGIVLNSVFVLIEAIAGFITNSLALLTDAGHNLSDVASLTLALLAFKLAKVKPTSTYTYGYKKTTILVAFLNAVILLVAISGIAYEAFHRIFNPYHILQGKTIAFVATIGIFINSITAYLFLKNKEKDLNIKGAYLHLAADALVSLGVVIAGILMIYTDWFWLDSVISFIIVILILFGTWGLLKDSLRLSLDAIPKGIDVEAMRNKILKIKGVTGIHHLHIWALSTTENALTVHIVLDDIYTLGEASNIKEEIKHLLHHLYIHHATIEIETKNCKEEVC